MPSGAILYSSANRACVLCGCVLCVCVVCVCRYIAHVRNPSMPSHPVDHFVLVTGYDPAGYYAVHDPCVVATRSSPVR